MLFKKTEILLKYETRAALCAIPGVGLHKAMKACAKSGIGYPYSTSNLNNYLFELLTQELNCCTWLEIRMRQLVKNGIKNLISIRSYHGLRHLDKLPVRGQRTRTNAATQKNKFDAD